MASNTVQTQTLTGALPAGTPQTGRTEVGDSRKLNKRDLQKIKTRRLILQAGRELFAAAGLVLPTVADVSKAASISRQAFYMHFESRDDLLLKLFDREVRWQMRAYHTLVLTDPPEVEVVRTWIMRIMQGFAGQHQYIAIMRRALAADGSLLGHIFQERRRFILRLGRRSPVFRLLRKDGSVDEARVGEMQLLLLSMEGVSEYFAFGAWNETRTIAVDRIAEAFVAFANRP
jgi:AcrR family transcriptional regulator